MRTCTYEFEVVPDDGYLVAVPYDLDGGTQGKNFEELCEMVADWLRLTIEDHEIYGKPMPPSTFGHEPRHGGRNVVFSVTAGRETVDKITASEAARELGVTPGRVTQMISAGLLVGWREGRNTYVTVDSVTQRLREGAHPGRPRTRPLTSA